MTRSYSGSDYTAGRAHGAKTMRRCPRGDLGARTRWVERWPEVIVVPLKPVVRRTQQLDAHLSSSSSHIRAERFLRWVVFGV